MQFFSFWGAMPLCPLQVRAWCLGKSSSSIAAASIRMPTLLHITLDVNSVILVILDAEIVYYICK